MEKTIKRTLKIHYTDGSEMVVEYVREEETNSITTQILKAIESNKVLIELEDRLFVVPINNLKYIEIIPAPPKLPKFTFRNARLIEN